MNYARAYIIIIIDKQQLNLYNETKFSWSHADLEPSLNTKKNKEKNFFMVLFVAYTKWPGIEKKHISIEIQDALYRLQSLHTCLMLLILW